VDEGVGGVEPIEGGVGKESNLGFDTVNEIRFLAQVVLLAGAAWGWRGV
jgi:hypothetical protein